MKIPKRLCAAVALWTVATSLMMAGIVLDMSALRGPSILVGLMGCVPTFWLLAEHVVVREVDRGVRQVTQAIGYAQAEEKVRQLR